MGFRERLGLLVILSGALPAQQPAKSTEGPQPGRAFMDVTSALGVDFQYMASHTPRHYLPQTMGARLALFDYDNDGRLDLFLVSGAPTATITIPSELSRRSQAIRAATPAFPTIAELPSRPSPPAHTRQPRRILCAAGGSASRTADRLPTPEPTADSLSPYPYPATILSWWACACRSKLVHG